MWAVGWYLPSSCLLMAGAHLASTVTLSRWWPLLCSCFSTFSAKALSASFPVRICLQEDNCLGDFTSLVDYNRIYGSARASEEGRGRQRLGLHEKSEFREAKCIHFPAWLLISYLKSLDLNFSSLKQRRWTEWLSVTPLIFYNLAIM